MLEDFSRILAEKECNFELPNTTRDKDDMEWRFKCTKEEVNKMISVTISLSGYKEERDVTGPRLIVGVLENMNEEWWLLYYAYYTKNKDYKYDKKPDEWEDGEIISFNLVSDEKKKGRFFAQPLLNINDVECVKALVDKVMTDCWNEK